MQCRLNCCFVMVLLLVRSKFCDSQLYNSSGIDVDSVFVLVNVNLDLPCFAVNLNFYEAVST